MDEMRIYGTQTKTTVNLKIPGNKKGKEDILVLDGSSRLRWQVTTKRLRRRVAAARQLAARSLCSYKLAHSQSGSFLLAFTVVSSMNGVHRLFKLIHNDSRFNIIVLNSQREWLLFLARTWSDEISRCRIRTWRTKRKENLLLVGETSDWTSLKKLVNNWMFLSQPNVFTSPKWVAPALEMRKWKAHRQTCTFAWYFTIPLILVRR